MVLQWGTVTNKAEKKKYADKIRISHRAAVLSCPDVNREKLPLKTFFWKSKQVHRILSKGNWQLNSLGATEHSPNEEDLVESSTGESTFSKTFALACTSYISWLLASHMKETFSSQGRTTKLLQVKPYDVYSLACEWKSSPWVKLDFLLSVDTEVSGLRVKRDIQPLWNVLKENKIWEPVLYNLMQKQTEYLELLRVTGRWRVVSGP